MGVAERVEERVVGVGFSGGRQDKTRSQCYKTQDRRLAPSAVKDPGQNGKTQKPRQGIIAPPQRDNPPIEKIKTQRHAQSNKKEAQNKATFGH